MPKTVRVRYVGPHDAVDLYVELDPLLEPVPAHVERGGELAVPAAFAERLLEQPANWALVEPEPRSKPRRPRRGDDGSTTTEGA
ncbi:MAG: hypothetical protein R3C15_15480 [Thermoleophilia bacterium]